MNLSAVDLNLFLVLHAVLETGSATGAARQLHVTQSAVSNALARLRDVLGDPLLVRSGKGLVPTPRCEALRPLITSAVAQLQAAVDGQQFDPAESTREFTISCGDNQVLCDMPLIVEAFSRHMPRARLRVVSIDYIVANDGLASGDVDAALAPTQVGAREGYFAEPLYQEEVAFVARKDHPRLRGTVLTKELFNEVQHVDLHVAQGRPGVGHRLFEQFMKEHGLRRNIALTVSQFIAAGVAASRSDYVAGMPGRTAEALCAMLPLKRLKLDPDPGVMPMALIWHTRTHADAGSRAFRELVIDALRNDSVPRRPPAARPSRRAS
ncbi:LysR family transcriptional regulator [Pyxidicoccus fallax]|uniref:LysR family transcriptional regulator n=1 Tax=Pyxidicoccus fallax TaxID=394095 RepID=A0A848LJR6_9BACT|nr:LysR family transcriptional regulator [Pyxidicoccus fallax]NMO17997.1 LysR family transcriptional regulator [Pyxidicoccus fallax]NPC79516.1 LysR family transcriptional regulator [Pyxidicoccus fallax]